MPTFSPITKFVARAGPYVSSTFTSLVAALWGRNGILTGCRIPAGQLGNGAGQVLTFEPVPPTASSKVVLNGIVVIVDPGQVLTLTIPDPVVASPSAPLFVIARTESNHPSDPLMVEFSSSVPANTAELARYDGTRWRQPAEVDIRAIVDALTTSDIVAARLLDFRGEPNAPADDRIFVHGGLAVFHDAVWSVADQISPVFTPLEFSSLGSAKSRFDLLHVDPADGLLKIVKGLEFPTPAGGADFVTDRIRIPAFAGRFVTHVLRVDEVDANGLGVPPIFDGDDILNVPPLYHRNQHALDRRGDTMTGPLILDHDNPTIEWHDTLDTVDPGAGRRYALVALRSGAGVDAIIEPDAGKRDADRLVLQTSEQQTELNVTFDYTVSPPTAQLSFAPIVPGSLKVYDVNPALPGLDEATNRLQENIDWSVDLSTGVLTGLPGGRVVTEEPLAVHVTYRGGGKLVEFGLENIFLADGVTVDGVDLSAEVDFNNPAAIIRKDSDDGTSEHNADGTHRRVNSAHDGFATAELFDAVNKITNPQTGMIREIAHSDDGSPVQIPQGTLTTADSFLIVLFSGVDHTGSSPDRGTVYLRVNGQRLTTSSGFSTSAIGHFSHKTDQDSGAAAGGNLVRFQNNPALSVARDPATDSGVIQINNTTFDLTFDLEPTSQSAPGQIVVLGSFT